MGATLIAAIAVLGLGVLGLCFNIIVRKKDFPQFDVGSNEEMRRRGIRCFKDVDAEAQGLTCTGPGTSEACKDCKLYESGSNSRTA
ncbi:MAG: hypothetical protein J6S62_04215 [Bacteroidales bacterium]|nr:hypothetical protein [Bacteroidales bacterium]